MVNRAQSFTHSRSYRSFPTAQAAEKAARICCKRFGGVVTIAVEDKNGKSTVFAAVSTDSLGRTWTDLNNEGAKLL